MIHYTPEGMYLRLGLNFKFAPGGFVIAWAWFDFATNEASLKRLRFRWHIKPRFLWSSERYNVINSFLSEQGMTMVSREVWDDLKATERDMMRRSEAITYVRKKSDAL